MGMKRRAGEFAQRDLCGSGSGSVAAANFGRTRARHQDSREHVDFFREVGEFKPAVAWEVGVWLNVPLVNDRSAHWLKFNNRPAANRKPSSGAPCRSEARWSEPKCPFRQLR